MKLTFRAAATLLFLSALGGAGLYAGPMQGPAIKYSIYDRDNDTGNGPITFLTSGQAYTSDFNLLEKGYDPLTMQITAARVTFAFADDRDSGKEYATVYLGGVTWMNGSTDAAGKFEVDGNHTNAPANYDYYYQEWSASNAADVAFLNSLMSGVMQYRVKNEGGDFYLKIAQLEIDTCSIVRAAEGGSTALLMIFSITGLAWHCFRRRRDGIAR